jgi:hypothetical protein
MAQLYTYTPFSQIQVYPEKFEDLLRAPCRVINLDRNPERWDIGEKRIREAGFTNVERVSAVDAKDKTQLEKAWGELGNPRFADWDKEFVSYPGKQGCFLSHFNIWKEVLEKRIPYMVVLEDDVLFHPQWKEVAPEYFKNTPKNYDVLYLGAQIEFTSKFHIDMGPVFCTHAMVITYNGVKKLWEMLLKHQIGVYTIDCMIIDMMKYKLNHPESQKANPFQWYVWNGQKFYPTDLQNMPKGWTKRNGGLVFQDESFGSEVRVW